MVPDYYITDFYKIYLFNISILMPLRGKDLMPLILPKQDAFRAENPCRFSKLSKRRFIQYV